MKKKQKLIDALCEQIKNDAINGDLTVLEEILGFVPVNNLVQALPEEEWGKYKSLLSEKEKKELGL